MSFNVSLADALIESGNVENIKGEAWANQPDQAPRVLSKKSVIYENDVVKTGEKSSISMLFKDKV
ncbi:MAG: hypothetical protein O7D86_06440 [Proteobacteria bacterium]|nr:hypothetical protein [Pseudomonadota bacterium]